MADDPNVAVEQSIHDALAEVAQRIYTEFSLRITNVHIEWRDESSLHQPRMTVSEVEIISTSCPNSEMPGERPLYRPIQPKDYR